LKLKREKLNKKKRRGKFEGGRNKNESEKYDADV